jgi:hypothetical protein
MASQPPSAAAASNNQNDRPGAKPRVPPEEQFWQHYSPHHEAPLSGIGSFAMHFLLIGFLVVAGYLGWLGLGNHRGALPNDVVRLDLGGGGGKTSGESASAGDGATNQEVADVSKTDENLTPADSSKPEHLDLKDPAVLAQSLPPEVASNESIKRFIKEGNENLESLAKLNRDIQSKLREGLKPAAEGNGGPGTGGGKGAGTGAGEGDARGDGSGKLSRREQRMLRWTMQFDTRSGMDYLRQLRGLGAILAIPKDRGGRDFWVIRDLTSRPPKLLDEDVSQIQRIFWIDDKPHSVASLVQALGLHQRPDRFVAFMPQELEEKLFEEELKYQKLSEEEIEETTFQVRVSSSGKYYPVVIAQRRR